MFDLLGGSNLVRFSFFGSSAEEHRILVPYCLELLSRRYSNGRSIASFVSLSNLVRRGRRMIIRAAML